MKTKLTGARAALADAIAIRNTAAKAVMVAEATFDDYERDAYEPARSKRYDAQEAIDKVEERIREAERQHIANAGIPMITVSQFSPPPADQAAVLRFFMKHDGKTPDELRSEARAALGEAEAEVRLKEQTRARLEALRDIARDELDAAKSGLEAKVRAVLREPFAELLAEATAAAEHAFKACAALNFVAGHEDRAIWSAALKDRDVTFYKGDVRRVLQDEGVAPWFAAFNQLFVDASAPLPIEPDTTEARAA